MDLDNRTIQVWNKANDCYCSRQDCINSNHKLCGICQKTMMYGAHESVQPTSQYSWNIDHIVPRSQGGGNNIENLQAVHVRCNREKGNRR